VVRQRPDHALPKKPAIDAAGTLAGGPNAVPDSVAYLTRECDIIQTTIDENRATEVESKKLTEMKIALNQLEAQVEAMAPQHPDKANIFTQATIDMAQLHSRVGKMKRAVLKKAYY
jgi:hypothetical protein